MDNQPENKTVGETSGKVPQFSVGAVLREGREQLGLSIADVANRIKFAPRQIEAMEADDFAHLPEMTFVRGFVRSYARLLEIDAAPLLAALPQKHVPLSLSAESKPVEVPFPSILASRRSNIIWLGAAALVALALIIFSRMHDSPGGPIQPTSQTSVETLELPMLAASAPVAAMAPAEPVAANVQAAPGKGAVSALPAARAQAAQVQPVREQPAAAMDKQDRADRAKVAQEKSAKEKLHQDAPVKSQPAVAAAIVAPVNAASAPAGATSGNTASLRLVFDESSWVEVKDATGKILLSKMNNAGSLVRLSGAAPLSIVIGHASGVQLYRDGKKINLAPHTTVEVARLVLE